MGLFVRRLLSGYLSKPKTLGEGLKRVLKTTKNGDSAKLVRQTFQDAKESIYAGVFSPTDGRADRLRASGVFTREYDNGCILSYGKGIKKDYIRTTLKEAEPFGDFIKRTEALANDNTSSTINWNAAEHGPKCNVLGIFDNNEFTMARKTFKTANGKSMSEVIGLEDVDRYYAEEVCNDFNRLTGSKSQYQYHKQDLLSGLDKMMHKFFASFN